MQFTKFDNIELPDWKTEKPAYVIPDTTKYCLVVFSASWCGPCHKMIPALKELYNEYGNKLQITYISTDQKSTMGDWKKLMVDKEIPWHSVLAGYENGAVSIKYFITMIPHAYLVHPDGSFEQCDIRDEASMNRLKTLVQ